MHAIILSIGDELVLGQTADSNCVWLSRQLATLGWAARRHVTVGDNQSEIASAIRAAVEDCQALLITGGLGPTADDLTRHALADVMKVPLLQDDQCLHRLEMYFQKIDRPMSPLNRIQAMIPRGATPIENTVGTAPGIYAAISNGRGAPCDVYVMPGVPREMKTMFTRDVLPKLQSRGGGGVILSRTLHTFGLGESAVAEKLGALMDRMRNPSVGTTVSGGIVSLRINARFTSMKDAQRELDATDAACRAALGELIFGSDDQTLQQALGRLLNKDEAAQDVIQAVTTAESCTGGLIAKMLTDVPGTSTYFRQAYVTYSNESKTQLLGVPAAMIEKHGAVSEPVVRAMATGAVAHAKAAYALAVSGIAGPGGGSEEKPVGTVWIALAHPGGCDARLFHFSGDRELIRDRSAKMALTMLRFNLMGKPLPF